MVVEYRSNQNIVFGVLHFVWADFIDYIEKRKLWRIQDESRIWALLYQFILSLLLSIDSDIDINLGGY